MEHAQRLAKIESYGNAHQTLVTALQAFPVEMWQFQPSADRWSIHQIIVHIADSEANSYIRCRRLIAEPGTSVTAYDENHWALVLNYHRQSTQEALELFKWLRLMSYRLIQTLPESAWSHTIHHPENGIMSMDDWLDVYADHIPAHIRQMQAVYEDWVKSR